jgi:endonuclease VIII
VAGDPHGRPRGGGVRRAGARADDRVAHPLRPPARHARPHVLAEDFDEKRFLGRLRGDDPSRGIADALLDQRNVAGIGNVWKAEGCFLAGLDPWRRTVDVSDEEVLSVVREIRPLMRMSVERGGRIVTYEPSRRDTRGDTLTWVFERSGLPCRRCGTLIRARGQGDDNRTTYWCSQCQS